MLDESECALFARLNLAAGKHSFAASSYEQARCYFEAGISLLHSDPWNQQYSLCLELFEMSAVVDLIDGNVETVSMKLGCILSNSKSFDDSLNARALRAKFLASQGQFVQAAKEIVEVLSALGEDFPGDISSSYLLSEISVTQTILEDTSKDSLLNLPPMENMQKLNTMKFMVRTNRLPILFATQ
jgi:predicted ATPase